MEATARVNERSGQCESELFSFIVLSSDDLHGTVNFIATQSFIRTEPYQRARRDEENTVRESESEISSQREWVKREREREEGVSSISRICVSDAEFCQQGRPLINLWYSFRILVHEKNILISEMKNNQERERVAFMCVERRSWKECELCKMSTRDARLKRGRVASDEQNF